MTESAAKLTAKRRAWLEQLRDHGPAASHSQVGYACRRAGWSEWFVLLKDGREMPLSALYRAFAPSEQHLAWESVDGPTDRECITEAGRAAISSSQALDTTGER